MKICLRAKAHLVFHWCSYCNEIDRVIARAKVRELKCIAVVFECDTRTSAKTVMTSNECEMYA